MDTSKFQHLPEGFKDVMNASANAVFLDNDYNNVYTNRNLYETFNTSDPKEVMRKLVEKRKKHDYRGIGIGDHFTLPPFESFDGNTISDAQIQIAGFDHYKHEPSYEELPISPFLVRCAPKRGYFCKVSDSIVLSYGYTESGSIILKSTDGGKTWCTYTIFKDIHIDTIASTKSGADNYEVYILWHSKQVEVVSTDVTSQSWKAISCFSIERLTVDEVSIEETIDHIVQNITASGGIWFLHSNSNQGIYWVSGKTLYDHTGSAVYTFSTSESISNIIDIKNSQGYANSYLVCTSNNFYEMSFSSSTALRTWSSSNTLVGDQNDSAFKADDGITLYVVVKKSSSTSYTVFDTFKLYDGNSVTKASWSISYDTNYVIQCIPDAFPDRFLILSSSGIISYPYTACGAARPGGTVVGGNSLYAIDSVALPIQDGTDRRVLTVCNNGKSGDYLGRSLRYIEKSKNEIPQHSYIAALELSKDLINWNSQGGAPNSSARQFVKVKTNSPVNFFAQIHASALTIVSSFRENFKATAYMTANYQTIGCVYVEGRDIFVTVLCNEYSDTSGSIHFKDRLDPGDSVLLVAGSGYGVFIFTENKKCYYISFSYDLMTTSTPYSMIRELTYPFESKLTNAFLVPSSSSSSYLRLIADQGTLYLNSGNFSSVVSINFSEPIVKALFIGDSWNSEQYIILGQTKFHFMNTSGQITSAKPLPSNLRNLDFISIYYFSGFLRFSAYKGVQLQLGQIFDLELRSITASIPSTEETIELNSQSIIQKEGKFLYADWMDRKSSDEQINLVFKIKGNPNSYTNVLSCLSEFEISLLQITKTVRIRYDGSSGSGTQGECSLLYSAPVQVIKPQECFFMNTNWVSHRFTTTGSYSASAFLTSTATDFSILPLFRLNPNARKIGAVWESTTMDAVHSSSDIKVLIYPDGDTTVYYPYDSNHKTRYETLSKTGDLLVFSI